jgi:histidyl-tRNA synthetase
MPIKNPKKKKKELLTSPKGMRDLIGDEYYAYQGFFEKASEIALYYGFKPIETPILEREGVFTSAVGEGTDIVEKEMYSLKTKGGNHLVMRPEGTAGIMRAYIENGMQSLPQPVMLYHYGPYFRHERPQKGRLRELRQFGLEILGTPKSVADAMVIRIITIILCEAGFTNIFVDINSIGDNDCRPAYVKLLTAYYRKHLNDVCADCRQRIKTNPLRVLDCKDEKCQPIKEDAPDSISALCIGCRQHFKEVLEYLEELGVPYRINNHLVRGLNYYTKTVFEIFDEDGIANNEDSNENENNKEKAKAPLAVASGGRYDYLSKTLGGKKDVPSVGGGIGVDRLIASSQHKTFDPRIVKKPKIYFIQIGFEAKLKSLGVIEVLRKAKVPIMHSLSKDSLSGQLAVAERLEIPFTIIFGQKEALENTIIVRNMQNRSQDTVKIEELGDYLKKVK